MKITPTGRPAARGTFRPSFDSFLPGAADGGGFPYREDERDTVPLWPTDPLTARVAGLLAIAALLAWWILR